MKLIDLSGVRFERLVVLTRCNESYGKKVKWFCVCDCGNHAVVDGFKLRSGETKSCGCLQRDQQSKRIAQANTRHGQNKKGQQTRTHKSWTAMIQRCTNPKNTSYVNYGGRGVKVCERWRVFENFFADMGERPEGKTLDRINVNGNYEPENCRWATLSEQQRNKRCNNSN
jgi:hypothetical protein